MAHAVEVLVGGGRVSYGSGCLLAPTLVLTAWHVVAPEGPIEVEHDGRRVPATLLWHGAEADIAVLGIEPCDGVTPPAFGDLARVGVRTVPFDLVGFPRHKRRTVGGVDLRDTDQVTGDIPAGANLKTGVLDLLRDGRPLTVGDRWAGLSGAAVFSRGLLVGVVTEAEEQGPLRALPIAPLLTRATGEPEAGRLLTVLRDAGVPVDVLPVRRRPLYRRAEEIVAAVPSFEGRSAEYRRLASVDGRYSLWQAGPWAGKTTFAAHFATHPPEDVDVVSFFVSRTRGQQAPQFWTAVCDQLAALLDEPAPTHPELAFADLWARACEHVTGQGRRLLLLVDGLDENTQPPPIALSLPRSVPPGAHVAVFTRPVDELLQDLYDHPLGDAARFAFSSNGLAGELGRRAVAELRELLTAHDRAPRQVLGALAAIGPLGVTDLAAICAPMDQGDVRRGLYAAARVVTAVGDSYVIAHEALREEIAAQTDTAAHLRAAVTWAERYADEDWQDTTPDALVDGYLPLLLAGERPLLDLTSEARARFLRTRTGDDIAHGRELLAAFDAVASADEPDMAAACVLARARTQLEMGYKRLPEDAALGWGLVGEYRRSEYLASFQDSGLDRLRVFVAVAEAAARAGDTTHAQRFLDLAAAEAESYDRRFRAGPLLTVAKAAHGLGEQPIARRLAELAVAAGGYHSDRASAEAVLAAVTGAPEAVPDGPSSPETVWALGALGLLGEADAAVPRFGGVDEVETLLELAARAIAMADLERARRLVREAVQDKPIWSSSGATELMAKAATLAAKAGDHDHAHVLLAQVEDRVRPPAPGLVNHAFDLCAVAEATAVVTGGRDRVRQLLETAFATADEHWLAATYARHSTVAARTAVAAARVGETGLAVRWLRAAEETARAEAAWSGRNEWAHHHLRGICAAAARTGRPDVVAALARSATAQEQWNTAAYAITGLMDAGMATEAAELAEPVWLAEVDDRYRYGALTTIGTAAAAHGDLALAERVVAALDGVPDHRDQVLAAAAIAEAEAGGDARRLLAGISKDWRRADAETAVAARSGIPGGLAEARRGKLDMRAYEGLLQRAGSAADVVGTLTDHVLAEEHPVYRALDACAAADLAAKAGLPGARTRLLEIAEDAVFGEPLGDLTGAASAMTTVVRAAARHGADDIFDRHVRTAVVLSSEDIAEAVLSADLNAYAGRFADADTVITNEHEPYRFRALLAAVRGALAAGHLDPAAARPWVRRWLLAALRIDLNGEPAVLLVRFDPRLAPLACTWFQLGNSAAG
jgi:hypothetical protein